MSQNIYLDAINLYGYGMPKFRPRSGFAWIDPIQLIVEKDMVSELILSILKN